MSRRTRRDIRYNGKTALFRQAKGYINISTPLDPTHYGLRQRYTRVWCIDAGCTLTELIRTLGRRPLWITKHEDLGEGHIDTHSLRDSSTDVL